MLDKILGLIAEEIPKLRQQNQPKSLYRPTNTSITANWSYTVPHKGMLYLAFVSIQRSYVSIKWNDAEIGDFAIPTGSAAGATVIPVAVKEGDIIRVTGLNSNCYLSSRTALISWGGGTA